MGLSLKTFRPTVFNYTTVPLPEVQKNLQQLVKTGTETLIY